MKKPDYDYYDILGVNRDANEETIRRSYRKKALQYHPDRNPGNKDSEEMFKKISEAYDVLSDPKKKRQYDNGSMEDFDFFSINPNDLFASVFGSGLNEFGFNFGSTQFQKTTRINPDNKIVYRTTIEDIIKGEKVEIQFKRQIACEKCFGSGYKETKEKCKYCDGKGKHTKRSENMIFSVSCNNCFGSGKNIDECLNCHKTGYHSVLTKISVSIPPDISPMSALRIRGKGNEVIISGQKIIGDTYIIIDYPREYKGIILDHGDIYTSINVPFNLALASEKIKVDILGCKDIELQLDSNNKSGYCYKVEKAGLQSHNHAYIKVFLDFPKNKISEKDIKKIVDVMREIYGESNTRFKPECSDYS